MLDQYNQLRRTEQHGPHRDSKNPGVQSFIRKLKVGDQVDIVYEEPLAIAVEPVKA